MSYKIIIDSCGELTKELKQDGHYASVPLELDADDYHVIDDETFDQQEFLRRVKQSKNCPKSSCPSPQRYVEAFEGDAEHVYIVTLSAKLSGSYNSAELARNLYLEEHQDKKIAVINSCSASVGETLIGRKVQELEEAGLDFEAVVERAEEYTEQMKTYFVLETLDTLRKNGRLSNLKAWVAGALNIKPVMGATNEGIICQLGQARGINRALDYMIEEVIKNTKDSAEKVLAISHCNCPQRAEMVKEKLEKAAAFKEIIVVDMAGVSTMYANDGGIIICV